MYVPIRHIVQGKENQDRKTKLTRSFLNLCRESGEQSYSYQNGAPRNSAKKHAHGADDISDEKESEETTTTAEKESGKTVTMSRANTISRAEGAQMTYNSETASGAHAQRASEVQANKGQVKRAWFQGLIL